MFDANTLCHAVTLTFDPLTLKVRTAHQASRDQSLYKICEIEQSLAMDY